jgi:hypothetical protein
VRQKVQISAMLAVLAVTSVAAPSVDDITPPSGYPRRRACGCIMPSLASQIPPGVPAPQMF